MDLRTKKDNLKNPEISTQKNNQSPQAPGFKNTLWKTPWTDESALKLVLNKNDKREKNYPFELK